MVAKVPLELLTQVAYLYAEGINLPVQGGNVILGSWGVVPPAAGNLHSSVSAKQSDHCCQQVCDNLFHRLLPRQADAYGDVLVTGVNVQQAKRELELPYPDAELHLLSPPTRLCQVPACVCQAE